MVIYPASVNFVTNKKSNKQGSNNFVGFSCIKIVFTLLIEFLKISSQFAKSCICEKGFKEFLF